MLGLAMRVTGFCNCFWVRFEGACVYCLVSERAECYPSLRASYTTGLRADRASVWDRVVHSLNPL